jgi:single-strand DNA-binding protein
MPSLNKVILVGRLTRDPEMRYTTSGLAVTTFSLAVDRRYKSQSGEKQTDFFRCKAWRQKAEFVANYVTKGRLVAVEGSIETSEVMGQDGQKKYFTDIVCDNIELLESTRDNNEKGAVSSHGTAPPSMGGQDGNYNAEYSAGGNSGGGGNGYFPDDDMSTARGGGSAAGNRPAPQNRPSAGNAAPQRPAQTMNRQPAPAQPAYPADDFDDSDPFSDE